MNTTLSSLLEPYRSVSIIGMCKNAGKTTVLNQIIREMGIREHILALTSIGRDGESRDLVTGTGKPGIYIPEGTILATAAELLKNCDVSREILQTTGFTTPMGEVVIFRARSDGSVQLAGPSITDQLARLREELFSLGADRVIIDGALSRKSLCSRKVTEATVLCTGASYSKSMDVVVEDTAYQCRLLTLPETQIPVSPAPDFRDILLLRQTESPACVTAAELEAALRQGGVQGVFFGGALSDFVLKLLLMSSAPLDGLRFVVRDSSKLLLKQESFEKLYRRGACVQVLDSVNPVAVTVNPFSAHGFHFDKDRFLERMQEAVCLPVINVREDAVCSN